MRDGVHALRLVPAGEPVFAAVTPGNARSLRAFLACGFTPVGSEVLLRPARATSQVLQARRRSGTRLVSRDSGFP
ncbi:hypothetical protein DY240_28965 [Jiangella rhizosphaerae]|uniref:GNAT family N-acetyltransferase n=1 Tax=Jiangella rhizosphaerae TaxID=2293569 RepID=A0A418KHB5_9ACTN|nr:hypothetical protein [Jiangella rhizosphaerae]RIQ11374.1 hypothetical protein DY240_28965 [Jiangella rhizosphaerae]